MPVEINQLHIKVNIDSKEEGEGAKSAPMSKKEKADLIAACTSAVLDILEQHKKR